MRHLANENNLLRYFFDIDKLKEDIWNYPLEHLKLKTNCSKMKWIDYLQVADKTSVIEGKL